MTWTSLSGNVFKLCLLDTNAISEILKNKQSEGKNFILKFPPSSCVPCFSFYNLIELRRSDDIYRKFISFFSVYPIFLVKPQSMVIKEEIKNFGALDDICVLLNAFTPMGEDNSYQLKMFIDELFSNPEIKTLETSWRTHEVEILNSWISNKCNFNCSSPWPNSIDAEKYLEQAGLQTLIKLGMDWCKDKIERNEIPDINKFPSVKIMLYSLYYRLYDPSWKAAPGEVIDILMTSVVPYIDIYITEKFQANIISKIRKKVYNLDRVSVKRIRDLR